MKSKGKGKFRSDKKKNQGSFSKFICYGCGEIRHVKFDCPNQSEEKEGKKFMKKKNKVFYASNSSDLDEEANIFLLADNESNCNKVNDSNSFSETNDYDELLYAFQELYVESEKLNSLHRKFKSEYKTLRKKFEKSLEEEENLKSKISIFEDGRNAFVECESCKENDLKIANLEKSIITATKIKIVKNPILKKRVFHKNKQAPKNKNKRTHILSIRSFDDDDDDDDDEDDDL